MFRSKDSAKTEDFDDRHHRAKAVDSAVAHDKALTRPDSFHASDLHPRPSLIRAPTLYPEPAPPQHPREAKPAHPQSHRKSLVAPRIDKAVDVNKKKAYIDSYHAHHHDHDIPSTLDETQVEKENLARQQRIIDEERKSSWVGSMTRVFSRDKHPVDRTYHPNANNLLPSHYAPLYINDYPALSKYYDEQAHLHDSSHAHPATLRELSAPDTTATNILHHRDRHVSSPSSFSPRHTHAHAYHTHHDHDHDHDSSPTLPERFEHKYAQLRSLLVLPPAHYDDVKGISAEQYGHYKDVLARRIAEGKDMLHNLTTELDSTTFDSVKDTLHDLGDDAEERFEEWKGNMYDNLSALIRDSNAQQRDLSGWLKTNLAAGKEIVIDAAHDAADYVAEVREHPDQLVHDVKQQTRAAVKGVKTQTRAAMDTIENVWDDLNENDTFHSTAQWVDEHKVPLGIGLATLAAGAVAYNAFSSSPSTSSSASDTAASAATAAAPTLASAATAGLLGLSQGALTGALMDFVKDNLNHANVDELWDSKLPAWVKTSLTKDQFVTAFTALKQHMPDVAGLDVKQLKGEAVDLANDAKGAVKGAVKDAKGAAQDALADAKGVTKEAVKDAKAAATTLAKDAKATVQDTVKDAKASAATLAKDTKATAKTVAAAAQDTIADAAQAVGAPTAPAPTDDSHVLGSLIKGGLAALLTTTAVDFGKNQLAAMDPKEAYALLPANIADRVSPAQFGNFLTMLQDYSAGTISPQTQGYVKDLQREGLEKAKDAVHAVKHMDVGEVKKAAQQAKDVLVDAAHGDLSLPDVADRLASSLLTPDQRDRMAKLAHEYNIDATSLHSILSHFSDASTPTELVQSTKDAYQHLKDEVVDKVKAKLGDVDLSDLFSTSAAASSLSAMLPLQEFCRKNGIDAKEVLSQLSVEAQNWLQDGKLDNPFDKAAWSHVGSPLDLFHNVTEGASLYKNKLGLEQQYAKTVTQVEGLWDDVVDMLGDETLVHMTPEQREMYQRLQNSYAVLKIDSNRYCNTAVGQKYKNFSPSSPTLYKIDRKTLTWPDFAHLQSATMGTIADSSATSSKDAKTKTKSTAAAQQVTFPQLLLDQQAVYHDLNTFLRSFEMADVKDSVLAPVLAKLKQISPLHTSPDRDNTPTASTTNPTTNAPTRKEQRRQTILTSIHADARTHTTTTMSSPNVVMLTNYTASVTDSDNGSNYGSDCDSISVSSSHSLAHSVSLTDDSRRHSHQSFGYSLSPSHCVSASATDSDRDDSDAFSIALFDSDNFSVHSLY